MPSYDEYISTDPAEAENEKLQDKFLLWLQDENEHTELMVFLKLNQLDLLDLLEEYQINGSNNDLIVETLKIDFHNELFAYWIDKVY